MNKFDPFGLFCPNFEKTRNCNKKQLTAFITKKLGKSNQQIL